MEQIAQRIQLPMKRGFRLIRLFTVSLIDPDGTSKTFEVPGSIYHGYFHQIAPNNIKHIVQKWQEGRQLNDDEYRLLVTRFLEIKEEPQEENQETQLTRQQGPTEVLNVFGFEFREGDFLIVPGNERMIEIDTLDFCLSEMTLPFRDEVCQRLFPKVQTNVTLYNDKSDPKEKVIDHALRIAHIIILLEFSTNRLQKLSTHPFEGFYREEFAKRAELIFELSEITQTENRIPYLPIFDSFRNYRPEDAHKTVKQISLLTAGAKEPSFRKMLEVALERQAIDVRKQDDEEAREIRSQIIAPAMSATVGMEKAWELLKSAQYSLSQGWYNACARNCYYAMFWTAQFAITAEGIELKWKGNGLQVDTSHGGIRDMFNKELVHTKKLYNPKFTKYLDDGYKTRILADYTHKRVEQGHAVDLIQKTEDFIKTVEVVAYRQRSMDTERI